MAKNYASIDAQNVTFDTVHNNAESQSKQSDLKVGMFARVISPIIDLAQAAESTKTQFDRVLSNTKKP